MARIDSQWDPSSRSTTLVAKWTHWTSKKKDRVKLRIVAMSIPPDSSTNGLARALQCFANDILIESTKYPEV